ncbi:MAG: fibronectin type protein, partial [Actinomycetia bacterium]|nr:fibronectin type protein [Actinomycetes bacterium]
GKCGVVGGYGGDYTEVHTQVTVEDRGKYALDKPASSGWVGVPPGRFSAVSVTALLVARLTVKKTIQDFEAFSLFGNTRPVAVRTLSGAGTLTCLCMGTSPEGPCGGGLPDPFSTVYTSVTPEELTEKFQPPAPAARTGWLAVDTSQAYNPLEVLLQLVTLLAAKKILTGSEPYDVFNKAMNNDIRDGVGGSTTCVALGAPVGQGCRTMTGTVGDVWINVSDKDRDSLFHPGPGSGWTTMSPEDNAILNVILQLVVLLFKKKVLTGDEPYNVFNNAHPSSVLK